MGREAAYSGVEVEWETLLKCPFTYGPELIYSDAARMKWGPFRTLQPPLPKQHDIFADPPVLPVKA
jgi:hypothetical protein